jgi:putative two-component system response regulator
MNVLVVDDDEIVLKALSSTLGKAGYKVQTAGDGRTALEAVRDGGCRLVISDWQMPGLNGLELCRAIRESDVPGYVYVILLTAHDSPDQKVAGLSAGADDFVVKPYNSAELIERVRAGERVLTLETRDVAIFAMAKLAESRDPDTCAHLDRVRGYCKLLAQQLATSEKFRDTIDCEFIRLIYQTSPLHDIGKVGIPDSVLLKPGRLSEVEFEIMKNHAAIGAETLEAAIRQFPGVKFLEMARDIAATHHERFNGSGYPKRLVGEQIPICGRIVALADVYDALTSRRVYKNAFSHDTARSTIVNERGSHFDPDVVDAFLAVEPQFIAVRERYSEALAAAA